MATPMSASQILVQLKKWGIKYKEVKSWEAHNRAGHGAWGPVNGFVWHHTGADVSDCTGYAAGTLYNGRSDLPGPLCHFGIGKDGTVYLIGWGRTNHAGSGDPDVLSAVVNESYGARPPMPNEATVDFNAHFYGVEIMYSGSHAMSAAQYEAALTLSAAICDFHGWSEKSIIGHGETGSPGKWDPGDRPGYMMNMSNPRADLAALLKRGPDSVAIPASTGDDEMPKFVDLATSSSFVLQASVWDAVEFGKEIRDEPGGHGTNGSQFIQGPARYSGTVSFRVSGLAPGAVVQVRLSEVDSKGDYVANGPISEVIGTAGDTFGTVSFVGSVATGRGVRVRIMAGSAVTVQAVSLQALVWG